MAAENVEDYYQPTVSPAQQHLVDAERFQAAAAVQLAVSLANGGLVTDRPEARDSDGNALEVNESILTDTERSRLPEAEAIVKAIIEAMESRQAIGFANRRRIGRRV